MNPPFNNNFVNPLNHHNSPNPCSDGSDVETTSSFGDVEMSQKPSIRPIRTETPQIVEGGSLIQNSTMSQSQNQPKVKLKELLQQSPMQKRFTKITPTSTPTASPFSGNSMSFTAPPSKMDSTTQQKTLGPLPRNTLPKPSPVPNFAPLGQGASMMKFQAPPTQTTQKPSELDKLLFNSGSTTATTASALVSSSQSKLGNSPQLPRLSGGLLKTPRTPLSQLRKPNLLSSPFAFKK